MKQDVQTPIKTKQENVHGVEMNLIQALNIRYIVRMSVIVLIITLTLTLIRLFSPHNRPVCVIASRPEYTGGYTMKTLTIIGKRWFQRTYGNIYHSISIDIQQTGNTGKPILFDYHEKIPFAYGYDNQWEYTAIGALKRIDFHGKPLIDTNEKIAWRIFDELKQKGWNVVTYCHDVTRKKDL